MGFDFDEHLNKAVMGVFADDAKLTIKLPAGDVVVSLIETATEELEEETGSHVSDRLAFFVRLSDVGLVPPSNTILVWKGKEYKLRHPEKDQVGGLYLHVWET